jgi:xanthine dehydrogenase accessory factor
MTAIFDLGGGALDTVFDWPFFGLQDDVRPALAEARLRGVRAVLATLYDVDGAAPRGVGAQMVFAEDAVTGFLSGGCIEADIVTHARGVLEHGRSERLTYGDGGPMDIRLPCGSRIDVLLEPLGPDDEAVGNLLTLSRQRRPAVWMTTGEHRMCAASEEAFDAAGPLRAIAALAASERRVCGRLNAPFGVYRTFSPPRRLMAIGADPIALAVVKLAVDMGFETLLVRPRGPEACPLPGVQYLRSDVRTAIEQWRPDPWTAIAVLGHDIDLEQAALESALATSAGYVGVLGSRRRIPDRNARLQAGGVNGAEIERVHAPIGLPIGGKSPWEIAVAVLAEIVAELDAGKSRSLSA